jgi:hypothetical protein
MFSYFHLMHVAAFFNIRSVMINKHSKLTKRQARDHYGRFASPSSHTTPPHSLRQEVGSSPHRSASSLIPKGGFI